MSCARIGDGVPSAHGSRAASACCDLMESDRRSRFLCLCLSDFLRRNGVHFVEKCSRVLALAGVAMTLFISGGAVVAKTPGETYCYNDTCRRVRTIAETAALIGQPLTLKTSFYDHCSRDRFNPCGLTSSGEAFRADDADNAASPDLPDGTLLLLFNPATQKAVVVRINNAGPYLGDRQLDVSRGAAEALGFHGRGVAMLEATVLQAPRPAEARYRHLRRYASVAGYIGTFASLGDANISLAPDATISPAIVVPGLIETDVQLASLITTLPDLVMPVEAPEVVGQGELPAETDVVAIIVASLQPLSARVLLGLPPLIITSDSFHHAVSQDVQSGDRAIAKVEPEPGTAGNAITATAAHAPSISEAVAAPSAPMLQRRSWLHDVIATAQPRRSKPTVMVSVRSAAMADFLATAHAEIVNAIELARPSPTMRDRVAVSVTLPPPLQ